MPLTAEGFIEALLDYVVTLDTGSPEFVVPADGVAGNATIGNLLMLENLGDLLGGGIALTLFEEPSTISRTGRRHQQERTIRFVCKGEHGQEAVNLCWRILQALENSRTFQTATFTVWIARPADKTPTVIAWDQGGTALADFVMTFYVFNRTG